MFKYVKIKKKPHNNMLILGHIFKINVTGYIFMYDIQFAYVLCNLNNQIHEKNVHLRF